MSSNGAMELLRVFGENAVSSPVPPARVLIVSFHSPPGGGVGGLRWWGLSRHLARRGWRVHLLSSQTRTPDEAVPEGMELKGIPPRTTLNDRYRRWNRNRMPSQASQSARAGVGESEPQVGSRRDRSSGLGGLRRELGSLLAFPDEGRGWLLPAARAVRRSVSTFRPSVVVSTGPPHSVHLAAAMGLRGSSIPWVVDFRDPWADEARAHLNAAWAVPFLARMEASVIRSSGRVLTTTPELARVLSRRYPGATVRWLPNGVDVETLPSREADPGHAFSLVHLGTLYHRRDPVPAVAAFARLLQRNPSMRRDGALLRFVGRTGSAYRMAIEAKARELGIADHVELTGVLPREEALRLLAGSTVSLVLAQDQETAVPAKIYEAAGMGLPALVITEPESASAHAGRRLGAAVHPPRDVEGMVQSLESAWSGEWSGELPSDTVVDYAELATWAEAILLGAAARR